MNLDTERVPVHTGAFVTGGHVGQVMGCLDLEDAKDIHGWDFALRMFGRQHKRSPVSGDDLF